MNAIPELSKEEKGLLKGSLVGILIVFIPLCYGLYYLLFGGTLTDRGQAIVFGLAVTLFWALFKIYKILSDLSSNNVLQGESKISDKGQRITGPYDQYIKLEAFGKKKISVQYADRNKFIVGSQLKYKIGAKTKMLLSYEIL
jgi:hypothetical protein